MSTRVTIAPIADWTDAERDELQQLATAVYPPEITAIWPGRNREWAAGEWGIRVYDDNDLLVSYAGVLLRNARIDDRPVRIGGVGGVKTHPEFRRQGFAAAAMQQAAAFFREQPDVAFAQLVCDPKLLDYYGRLGWREFTGEVHVTQFGEPEVFSFNRVMTLEVHEPGPITGTIDLNGPPW